jgi:hypothetical protein
MATPAQGASFAGLPAGLTNVKISRQGQDPTSTSNRLDASTLDLAVGSNRVYVDGLPDSGAGAVGGITTTVTASFFGPTGPTAGDEVTIDGVLCRCTQVEIEYAVGELVKGTATYVSIPEEE